MPPLIGISLCLDASERVRRGRRYHYIDERYADAVAEAGGVPIYLPIQHGLEEIVDRIDGLLIPGGDDLLAEVPYPGEVRFEATPSEKIEFDRALLARAFTRSIPVFCICYGMQLLALHHRGSLHYHIPIDAPEALEHQLPEGNGRHTIRVEPGTRLAAAIGTHPEPVNSSHHQAVARAGEGLRVSARAADGVIEAVEGTRESFCLGVQWHPERVSGTHRTALFGAFVSSCRSVTIGP